MNKLRQIKTLTFFLIFSCRLAFAQETDIHFRQISPPGGFVLDRINTIVQDDLGYIWMGTRQGLIRYDSKNTKWFIPIANDSLSLPDEVVNNIFSDAENQIWISTNRGLCQFDREKQKFNRIKYTYEDGSKSDDIVLATLRTDDDRLLIIDQAHFGYLNLQSNQLVRIGTDQIKSPRVLYKDNFNKIWIGTSDGDVFRYFPSTNTLNKVISTNIIINSIYAENKLIWIGTEGEGAKLYTSEGKLLKQISFNKTSDNTLGGHVRVIKKDTYGRMWFGAYEGLYMDDGNKLTRFKPDDYPGLPHNSIYDIYEDKKGALWIGTWAGGLTLIHHSDNNFKTYRQSSFRNSISNNMVSSFIQADRNELLIGTEVGGLNSFNLTTEEFNVIQLTDNQQIDNIKSLCKDKQGGIWVGTLWHGLWYRPAGSTKFKSFYKGPEDGNHISSKGVYSLCAVDSGVWIGTFSHGINFYSFKTKSIRYCFKDTSHDLDMSSITAQSIITDSNSNLWLGTLLHFLYKVHLPSGRITQIVKDQFDAEYANLNIYYLWKHSSGDIWIGTRSKGLLILHPDSNQIEEFDAGDLLKGKNVYGIIEDQNKKVWITSSNGLIFYDPEVQTKRHFMYTDGIQSHLFAPQPVYKDDKGNLYFGGTNGFTRINPAEIKMNLIKPLTSINEVLTINNKSIFPNHSNIFEIETIYLHPKETTFRINFSADNYLMPEKNKYKYRLVNYYNEWVDIQNEGSVLFTNLRAGEYTFKVKACNNDGLWSDSPTKMKIVIEKFWYRTNVAYLSYFSVFAIILYFFSRFHFERLKLKRAVIQEKNKRENEELIHEMKLKFFTNISHEFRTPLTLISWPLKRLISADNLTEEQHEELVVVNRNSKRLLQLINQIVDFRKLEKGKSELNISRFDVIKFIKELQLNFSSEDKSHAINFVFESPYSALEIEADYEKLDTIIFNLLSNAYKYISEKGQIKISVNKTISHNSTDYSSQLSFGEISGDDFVEIAIEDTGSGIDSEDLLKIFNRFEQGKQNTGKDGEKKHGSGIGLSLCKEYSLMHNGKITAQSNVGKGSRFTIILPAKQKAHNLLFESHHEFQDLKITEGNAIKFRQEELPAKLNHILVVEDNKDFRIFICNFLTQYYIIEFATNGEEALEILKKHNIELVISDVMMPKMDGFELCSIIKSQVETCHIPVILLTALSSSENLIVGLDKGADAYLTKPFDENILIRQIENILDQRRRIHENFSKQFISQKTVEVGSLDNFFLNRVRKVVEKNITDENFGMEMLAEELMISRSQLHRKIKALSGETTSDFVNLIRIKKAVELIKKENYLFNEVAFHVGFSSQSYFTKCFKKVYNSTPKDYFAKPEK